MSLGELSGYVCCCWYSIFLINSETVELQRFSWTCISQLLLDFPSALVLDLSVFVEQTKTYQVSIMSSLWVLFVFHLICLHCCATFHPESSLVSLYFQTIQNWQFQSGHISFFLFIWLVGLKPILRNTTSFSALTLLVGSFDPQKPSPKWPIMCSVGR